MLAGRFRIIALAGKGGMGEVYRAEDVKLGQQVALKFLPESVGSDPAKLARLYDEVRLGRQVSHPNVSRLYDVNEWDGHHFISMEYIDGEDLASLLRRIGSLPPAKALDVARDICAGLAAAHSLGIIHRDLKPANVMIDGKGAARITDFGLAALADDLSARREIAGTPAYMAPEQLAGQETTARTDLYALGLLLYEIFTGKRLFQATTLGEIIAQHETPRSHSVSQETKDIDPAVQRVILRCLEEKPEARPPSIHSVIASLPGGDPLQAALDAGETPSPEMVAAAGERGELRPAVALALLAAMILLVLMNAALSKKAMLYGRVTLPKTPDVLVHRAREVLAMAGYPQPPVDVAYNFGWNNDYFESDRAGSESVDDVRPSPVVFYYRESPRELMAVRDERRVTSYDPPLTVSGMGSVELDPAGRLIRMTVVPPEFEAPPAQTGDVDWLRFVSAAAIDAATLRPVAPVWRAPVDSDRKQAWEARYAEQPEVPVRVEVASHHGRPVWFSVIPPWQKADRTTYVGAPPSERVARVVIPFVGVLVVWAALYLALRNVRRSRSDRRGAMRLAIAFGILNLVARGLRADHVWNVEEEFVIFTAVFAEAVVNGLIMWLVYVAIEPYFRRRWPRLLISWSRLVGARFRDPMVGRDILIGSVAGAAWAALEKVAIVAPGWLGLPLLEPVRTYFTALTEIRHVGYLVFNLLHFAIFSALIAAFVFLLVHIVTRSGVAALGLLTAFLVATTGNFSSPWQAAAGVIGAIAVVIVFRSFGLLAMAAVFVTNLIIGNAPMTLDTTVWYFGRSLFLMALMVGLAAWACWVALAAQPVLRLALLEED